MTDALDWCLKQQMECAEYLASHLRNPDAFPDSAGAEAGLKDALMEEAILRTDLRAPFPWFGGKSKVADLVWERFGNVPNYVEPFFGSGAVLLGRPHDPKTETINDLDCYVANFWRAIKANPASTAIWADWPVNEADMLARHKYLLACSDFRDRVRQDCDFYDCRIAGWWAWGLNIWIGDGWCRHEAEQLPHLGSPGKGMSRGEAIYEWFSALSARLRDVRVCCGEWDRVLGDSVTVKHGITGVFLDPPYDTHEGTYAVKTEVSDVVRQWAIANGENPDFRIALCGYEGEHLMPDSWECVPWKARKGYQKVAEDGSHGGERERIWFSSHCLTMPLFEGVYSG